MNKPIIIGIAGGSASGKTSIANKLRDTFSDEKSVLIIRQDDYYKDQSHMPMEERYKTNYDHPFAFDNECLITRENRLIKIPLNRGLQALETCHFMRSFRAICKKFRRVRIIRV